MVQDPLTPGSGDVIGRYVIIERIGVGGMGLVYSAHDPELGRRVAIKLLRHTARTDPTEKRLLHEAQILARLVHPNVVTVFDVGSVDGRLFLAMELIDGGTVHDWLRTTARSWRQIRDVFVDAGRGLAAAHQAGVVHRDFKPQNVLVGTDGRVCVTDFGLSRAPGDDVTEGSFRPSLAGWSPSSPGKLTETGAALGTPAYMAPEQHQGVADERSDQYSFCVALSEAFDGKLPGAPSTTPADFPPAPTVPSKVRRAVARGLSPVPADRYPSMRELLAELTWDPLRRRRQTIGAVAGLALVALTVTALGRSLLVRRQCGDGESRFARVLSPARWARLASVRERSVAAVDPHLVAETRSHWVRFFSELERYQQAWLASYGEACEETRVRHQQSPLIMEARVSCLEAALASVDVFAGALEQGDHAVELRMTRAATQILDPLEPCNDRAAPARDPGANQDASSRARLEELTGRYRRVAALDHAGDYQRALHEAGPLITAARATHDGRLLAAALSERGLIEQRMRDGVSAQRDFTEAALVGEGAHVDVVVATARAALVGVVGTLLNRPAEARALVPQAQSAIERVGGGLQLQVHLLFQRSLVALQDHQLDEARQLLNALVELIGRTDDPALQQELASAENDLGNIDYEKEHFSEARGHFQRAVALSEPTLGPHHPLVLAFRLNLERTNLVPNPEAMHDLLRLFEEAYGKNDIALGPPLSRYAQELMGQPRTRAQAPAAGRRALALYAAHLPADDEDVMQARGLLGEILLHTGDPVGAERELRAVVAHAEHSHDEMYLRQALVVHAQALLELARFAEAKREVERARSMAATPDPRPLATEQMAYARALGGVGEHDRARKLARTAIANFVAVPMDDDEELEAARAWLRQEDR